MMLKAACLVLVGLVLNGVVAGKLPLRSSKDRGTPTYRTPGCKLGVEFYPLEQTWSPAMEQVKGTLHCVQCICLPVVKKGVLQQKGRVVCRNIKDDCPALKCGPRAILLPKQCCKSCPGEEPFTVKSIKSLVSPKKTSTDRDMAIWSNGNDNKIKEFVALMTPHPGAKTNAVARGRFTLRYGNLHFSIQFNKMKTPQFIKIVDSQDNMLFEHTIDTIEDDMVCAVWRDIPSVYMSFLLTGKLKVSLEDSKDKVTGNVITHRALGDETFSSLLASTGPNAIGAIAMMTLSDDGKSLMFIVRFSSALKTSGATFKVKFTRGKRTMKEFETGLSSDGLEFVEMWSALSGSHLKQLVRGRLDLVVENDGKKFLQGQITIKQSCGVYQAILSGRESSKKSTPGAGGSSVIKISSKKGRISYSIHIVGLESRVTDLSIERPPNKRGKSKKVIKLTRQYKTGDDSFDGWANGTTDRIKGKDIQSLVQGKLHINVQTESQKSALRGELSLIPSPNYGVETIGTPLVLIGKNVDPVVPTTSSGLAWLTIDSACKLQYQVYLGGLNKNNVGSLMAQFRSPSYREQTFPLNNFRESLSEGVSSGISAELLNAMNTGDASLEITTKSHPGGILRSQVKIPNKCGEVDPDVLREQDVDWHNEDFKRERTKCLYDGHVYKDGQSWVPVSEASCTTCSCKTGKILCHAVACPKLECENPVLLDGECCPQCITPAAGASQCTSPGDERVHYEGNLWHPYVPPFGYSECAVCFCKSGSTDYDCKKLACPKLDCPDSVAIRKNDGDCCKVCPFYNDTASSNALLDTGASSSELQGDDNTGECRFQGQLFPPGARWNPFVPPFGTVKCVICSCTDGRASCKRKECNCKKKADRSDTCCQKTCGKGKKRKSKKMKRKPKHKKIL